MEEFNLNNKQFVLLQNSDTGEVDKETIFSYQQKGNLVTADYSGGTIIYGKIIAHLEGDQLNMLYQCYTNTNELKAGKAIALISETKEGKLTLSLDWEWLNGTKEKGESCYIEV